MEPFFKIRRQDNMKEMAVEKDFEALNTVSHFKACLNFLKF